MDDHAWLPLDDATAWCNVDENADDAKRGVVKQCRDAAAAYIERVRPDLFTEGGGVTPDDAAFLAGTIATKRLYARLGGSGFAEFGPAVALLELDPDVSALLGLGPHAAPRVG